uniref:Plastid division protein PDV1 n=1 Tax=Opuntia streptacantha TaxID=393608 RepID=A0A7C9DFB4_OPUST
MKFEMEIQEVEAVLEKIWDLHDKLSDAIHSISRTHFSKSFNFQHHHDTRNNGFVFVKDDDRDKESAILEAKSLNSIRSALENLEDHLEFFHTVQIQQRAERDAALARLEQSRLILALRLAEHRGKRCKVIDDAMNFIGDVRDASCFVRPENLSNMPTSAHIERSMHQRGFNSKFLVRVLLSSLDSARRTLQLDRMGGVLGNAAVFAFSMLALLHLHQVNSKGNVLEIGLKQDINRKNQSQQDGSSANMQLSHLDVRLARG